MKRSAVAVLVVLAAALSVAGCGGGSSGGSSSTAPSGGSTSGGAKESGGAAKKAASPDAPAGSKVVSCSEGHVETMQLHATAVNCRTARTTMQHWESSQACTLGKGGSRSSCSLGGFRCQAVRVDKGAAVSCARPGGDVAWIAKAWMVKKPSAG
jgi:hypothetical protein